MTARYNEEENPRSVNFWISQKLSQHLFILQNSHDYFIHYLSQLIYIYLCPYVLPYDLKGTSLEHWISRAERRGETRENEANKMRKEWQQDKKLEWWFCFTWWHTLRKFILPQLRATSELSAGSNVFKFSSVGFPPFHDAVFCKRNKQTRYNWRKSEY